MKLFAAWSIYFVWGMASLPVWWTDSSLHQLIALPVWYADIFLLFGVFLKLGWWE